MGYYIGYSMGSHKIFQGWLASHSFWSGSVHWYGYMYAYLYVHIPFSIWRSCSSLSRWMWPPPPLQRTMWYPHLMEEKQLSLRSTHHISVVTAANELQVWLALVSEESVKTCACSCDPRTYPMTAAYCCDPSSHPNAAYICALWSQCPRYFSHTAR